MSIKSDRWIREMATTRGMIDPFEPGQVRVDGAGDRIVSYGTSSYGYDVRCAPEFKIFTNINSAIVDPKSFDSASFVDVVGDTCIIPPNSFALARTVEYFRIPRNVLTICLGKSTYARCFSGDTRVALVDGRAPSFTEMVEGAGRGERHFGYGVDSRGHILVTELIAPRRIGHESLLELVLDDGSTIRTTPDHRFMLRDGEMLAAGELSPGTSLMPLYRTSARGHESTYQPATGHMRPTRLMADASSRPKPDDACHDRYRDGRSRRAHPFRADPKHRDVRAPRRAFANHKVVDVRAVPGEHDVYCLSAPETGNFALDAGVFVSNCGIIVNVTPLEPEWEGHVTLEFSNTTPLPAKIYANEGIAQMLFLESDETCETSYADRGGKYQGQEGVTLPRT